MRAYQWVLLVVFGFIALVLVMGASTLMGYYYSAVSFLPEVIVETVMVDNPVEVVVTKEVIKTVMVKVEQSPLEASPTATPEPLVAYPTETMCEDSAWVVMQPRSNLELFDNAKYLATVWS